MQGEMTDLMTIQNLVKQISDFAVLLNCKECVSKVCNLSATNHDQPQSSSPGEVRMFERFQRLYCLMMHQNQSGDMCMAYFDIKLDAF